MFSKIDESLKSLEDSFYNFVSVISAQSERMNSRLLELRVERSVLDADNVATELNDLNFKDEYLEYFAHESQRIKHKLHEDLLAYEKFREDTQASITSSNTAQDGNGWLGRMLGRQKDVIQNDPELNDNQIEEYKNNYTVRLNKVSSVVEELEKIINGLTASLSKWSFHFKERVVDLSFEGYEKNMIEISLCESLVSIFSHHAAKYPNQPFRISCVVSTNIDADQLLDDEIGDVLLESLQEMFLD